MTLTDYPESALRAVRARVLAERRADLIDAAESACAALLGMCLVILWLVR